MLALIKKNSKLIVMIMLMLCIVAFLNPTFAVVSPTSQFYVKTFA